MGVINMYEKEIEFLRTSEEHLDKTLVQNQRQIYTKDQIENIQKQFPNIPNEYLKYLSQIGEGSFLEELCTVFGDLIEVEDFFDETLHEYLDYEEEVLQFGCDFSGNALVFLIEKEWNVGVIYHDDLGIIEKTGQNFKEFISEKIMG